MNSSWEGLGMITETDCFSRGYWAFAIVVGNQTSLIL